MTNSIVVRAAAGVSRCDPREDCLAGELDGPSDNKSPATIQASRLVYLNVDAGAHALARQLRRELGELRFAHLRRAIAAETNKKPATIEHRRAAP